MPHGKQKQNRHYRKTTSVFNETRLQYFHDVSRLRKKLEERGGVLRNEVVVKIVKLDFTNKD